jgi:uncharacterized protein
MRQLKTLATLSVSVGVLLAASASSAADVRFSTYSPLLSSAGPTADEAFPITLANPAFTQRSIADRQTQLAAGAPNTGAWDMITLNETRDYDADPDVGRYLFTVFETSQAGVQRHDLATGETDTIWISPVAGGQVSFDATYWTPWGSLITAEEASSPNYGRLFELQNPLTAPAILGAPSATSNDGAVFVHQNAVPRTAHEGIQFDKERNMYFIDELNGGCIYKFKSAAKLKDVLRGTADYFAAGQTFVLRVGDGSVPNATGPITWVPFTDEMGAPLPSAVSITDSAGVTSVDARSTTDLAAFKGTDYQRPEDLQFQIVNGRPSIYFTTTTTNEVYRLDLKAKSLSVFADRNSINLATGAAVGAELASPDNLAIDSEGNLYIIEDRNGGVDDDIWFANDVNKDGDLTDPGEGLGRWASNGTPGSEFSGLYFDPFNKNRAWVNIQHPTSGNDRTIEIVIPQAR